MCTGALFSLEWKNLVDGSISESDPQGENLLVQ